MLIKAKETNGINFFNGDFETYGTKGWIPYKGTSSATPLNEIYTSPVRTSFFASSNSPLIGSQSGLISKSSGDGRGEGVYTDFTLDEGLTISTIKISFFYKTSSDYVDNDIGVFIYDRTNNVLIPLSISNLVKSTTVSKFEATFIPSNSKNYRLYFHIKSINALEYQVRVDEIELDSKFILSGSAISEWQSYTPTGIPSNVPGSWTEARYRRVGSSIQVRATFVLSGVPTGTISLSPDNLFRTALGITAGSAIDRIESHAVGVDTGTGFSHGIWLSGPIGTTLGSTVSYWNATVPFTWAANDQILFYCEYKVNEWANNVNLASDFQEFASNNSDADADAGVLTSVYGPNGSPMPNATFTAHRKRTVRFNRPIQATDKLFLEIYISSLDSWVDISAGGGDWLYKRQASFYYGIGIYGKENNTDVTIQFGQYALATGSTYGSAGTAWSTYSSGYRWRVRKISNGNMAEINTYSYYAP